MSGPLRTKVLSAWDYRLAELTEFCVPFSVDREQLAGDILSLRKRYACLIPVQTVETGDIATVCCRSSKPKFQKDSITVNVGKNLYSRELEAQLPGMAVGDEKTLTIGDTAVTVRILKAERNTLPELTDEFLSSHFRETRNMEQLEAWYVNEQYENHLKQQAALAADFMQEQALALSQILLDGEECSLARTNAEKVLREMWEMNGLPLDQMTDDQAQEILGCPSARAYLDWFAELCVKDVSFAALGYEVLARDGNAPTEASYREALRKMTEDEGTKEEQLSDYTYGAYVRQVCAEHYRQVLEAHAYQFIKERLS